MARLFGGSTTAQVIAARQLAQQSASSVPEGARVAELIRAQLFIANEYATVNTLNPQNSRRYQPASTSAGNFTACNLYVFDVLRAMGVPETALPSSRTQARNERRGRTIDNATRGGANQTANEFLEEPLSNSWTDLGTDARQAQQEADQGRIVICAGAGTGHHAGHYSVVMPQSDHHNAHGMETQNNAGRDVYSPVESNAGGGRPALSDGSAAPGEEHPENTPREERNHTANWNYESRGQRASRNVPHGRHVDWWKNQHTGHFLVYNGGGASNNADERSTYRLESERSMGMDYER